MKIYPIGYTLPGDQAFLLPMVPSLLRITPAVGGEGAPQPIDVLLANFAGETVSHVVADSSLFKAESLHYSADYQISQLQQNAAANAVLKKYLPQFAAPSHTGVGVLPLSALPKFIPNISADQIQAMQTELAKIPVE